MSEVSYTVVLVAGTHTWTVTSADDPDYGLMDGLTITRSTPESDISPAQPAPAVATFGIVAETVGDIIPDLDIGGFVTIAVWFPAVHGGAAPNEFFSGRITDLDVVPHRQGVLINVTAVDWLADLAELPNYDSRWVVGTDDIAGRLTALFAYYGMTVPPRLPLYGHAFAGDGPETWTYSDVQLLEAVEKYLRQWLIIWPGATLWGRYVLQPKLAGDGSALDPTNPYVLFPVAIPAHQRAFRDAYIIDANNVDVVGSFNRTKADSVTALDVVYYSIAGSADEGGFTHAKPGQSSIASSGTGAVRATLETLLSDPTAAAFTAGGFQPATDTDWRVDSFTWHLKGEPAGTYLPNSEPYLLGAGYLGPVDIINLDPRWSPVGTTYHGILAGYTLTLEKARPTVQLDLRDALP